MITINSQVVSKSFTFPDGQPHIDVGAIDIYDEPVQVKAQVRSPQELFEVAMVTEILHSKQTRFSLRIVYLMGARMDRRLSPGEPYTLKAVADIINSFEAESASVFCPHSQATSDLIHRYDPYFFQTVESDFYYSACEFFMGSIGNDPMSLVLPDAGSEKRFDKMPFVKKWFPKVVLAKHREERTGEILGIKILEGTVKPICLIVDDLCDGGRTFIEASKALRKEGAEKVYLAIPHGVFSKGLPLEGIDGIYTTNSFYDQNSDSYVQVYKII
jgi:ribose-phosphate pyrophosphokinase